MPTVFTPPVIGDLTQATLAGSGVFDVLMRANKVHLEAEFDKNRIRGPEYSQVYLGSLQSVMQTGLAFLLQKDKVALEAQLIEQQILLAQVEVLKANVEMAILQASLLKIPAEIDLLEAQTAQATQQTVNLVSQELQIDAQTALVNQQKANAILEGTVLVAQECKLRAEFDLLVQSLAKTAQETALLTQKVATEKAQILALGVDDNSVLGKQKALYQAQTDGFARDAEQKAAKLMADTWNVRRTTDEATVADATNNLNDVAVGRAITKLLAGVNA